MRTLNTLFFLLFCASMAIAQTPGGVGTNNLSGWWNAGSLTLGNVTSWTTTYPSGGSTIALTESAAPYPVATNVPLNATSNYNTTVDFTGNSGTSVMVLENQTNLNLVDVQVSTGQGTFFVAYYLPPTQVEAGGHIICYREATSGTVDGIQLRAKLGTNTGRLATGTNNSANASHDWIQDFRPDIISYYGNRGTSTSLHTYQRAAEFTGGVSSATSGDMGLHVGARRAAGTSYSGFFDGFISELIFFHRDLNATERCKVHTYLALKYGISLSDGTGGGDYIASNSAVAWDASLNPTYHHEVIGLARDDSSGLLQKQSHVYADDFRIYIDALQTTNVGNTGSIAANNAFVIVGNNQDATCNASGKGDESPGAVGYYLSRLSREWKVSRTNFAQAFNLDIKLDTCAMGGGLLASKFNLLVDADGDFTNATVFQNGSGISMTYNAGWLTVTGITPAIIPDNSTSYFTIGYELPLVSISSDTTICVGDSVPLTWSIPGLFPMDVTLSDGTNNVTYPNISNGDMVWVTPTATTRYAALTSGPLHCCMAWDTASVVTVTVESTPPLVIASVFPSSTICLGDSVLFVGSGAAISYTWTGGVIDNMPFAPAGSGMFTVTGTGTNNCKNTDSVFVEVFPLPNPALGLDAVLCTTDSLTLNPGVFSSYVWQDSSTGPTYAVQPAGTGTYAYWVEVADSNGCMNSDSMVVEVVPLPNPGLGVDTLLCTTDQLTLSPGVFASYVWQDNSTGPTYLVQPGPVGTYTYWVQVTDSNGCSNSDSIVVVVDVCIGVENAALNSLEIHPNPTEGPVVLSSKAIPGELDVQVFDAVGRLVYRGIHTGERSQLDLSGQGAGLYLVAVTGNGFRKVIRLVKQ